MSKNNKLIERELKGQELILTLITMLKGEEGKDWVFYEQDFGWWALRLYTRIN